MVQVTDKPTTDRDALAPPRADGGTATRYLGSKARIAGAILDLIGDPSPRGVFIDAFAGTGAVAREAAIRGWPVRVNDHLFSASRLALANVVSSRNIPFSTFDGYHRAIKLLNDAPARKGFIWREYSPASTEYAGVERPYFTEGNAARVDGVRARIAEWATAGRLSEFEEGVLIADLLVAASRVANTAGTYGCFLRRWQQNAHAPLTLAARRLLPIETNIELMVREVNEVPATPNDVAYFDPPYTKRQYAAYYHILETIAYGDEPTVSGVTGLRPWEHRASDFCYRSRALRAIIRTVTGTGAARAFLSYSSEGHVNLDDLRGALSGHGRVAVHDVGKIGRYAPNANARENGSTVTEYLIEFTKSGEIR